MPAPSTSPQERDRCLGGMKSINPVDLAQMSDASLLLWSCWGFLDGLHPSWEVKALPLTSSSIPIFNSSVLPVGRVNSPGIPKYINDQGSAASSLEVLKAGAWSSLGKTFLRAGDGLQTSPSPARCRI